MRNLIILSILFLCLKAGAQQPVFTQQEFFQAVRTYHPVARLAGLKVEMAKADITSARAGFDPLVQYSNARKELDQLLYYNQQVQEVKIPTWYGLDIQAGIEQLSGSRTNPVDTRGGNSYIGFSMPVVKDLLMDKRRAALKQAKIFQEVSEEEQKVMLNNLLLDAAKAYWNWWEQYKLNQLFTKALKNAEQRLRLVRTAYAFGDRPAFDTLEALTQLQTFRMRQSELAMQLNNARLELSVFLWQENNASYELPEAATPQQTEAPAIPVQDLPNLLSLSGNHPELLQYNFKLQGLRVDKKLKFQSLLPSVYLKYNHLYKGTAISKAFTSGPLLENNYRYGISVSLPLRLSEGRGEFKKASIKIEQMELEQLYKRAAIQNKIKQYYNEWQQLQQQVKMQAETVFLYAALQNGEEQKFLNGESSLFLVNAREQKLLEGQQKQIELTAKSQKAVAGICWAAGVGLQ